MMSDNMILREAIVG